MNIKKKENSDQLEGGRSAHFSLIVCTILFTINFMDRSVLSAVMEPMKLDLGLTDSQAGMLQTGFFISLAIMSTPVAFLVDRWSRKKSIGLMALLWSGFTYMTGIGRNFLQIFMARVSVAVGEAGFSSGSVALLTASYQASLRGRIMGIFNLGIPIGSALGVVLGGYLSAHHGGWRTPFYLFAIPGALLGILAFFMKDYKTEKSGNSSDTSGFFQNIRELFRIPTLRWNYFGYAMMNAFVTAVFAWFPALMIRVSGIGEDKAGGLMALVLAGTFIGTLSGGFIADALFKKNPHSRLLLPGTATLVSLLVMMAALFLFSLKMMVVTLLLLIIVGGVSTIGIPAQQAVTQEVVRPGLKGMSFGLLMFMMYFGGGWSPLIIGTISDSFGSGSRGLVIGFAIVTTVTLLLSSLCFFRGARYYIQDAEKYELS